MTNKLTLLLTLMTALLMTTVACSDLEEDCDPATDDACICTLDEDGTEVDDCIDNETDDGEACSCSTDPGPDNEPECGNDVCEEGETPDNCSADCEEGGPVCGNDACEEGEDAESCAADCDDDGPISEARFVLLQDDTPSVTEGTPGSDVDAIGLIKGDGSGEFFAQTLSAESDVSCEGNDACDTSALLDAPDVVVGGECFGGGDVDTNLFTSLNQGFVIVGFSGGDNGDQIIENGDSIHVYEIGATECGRFDDDPYSVSVGVSDTDTGAFVDLAVGEGSNIIPVEGLP